VPGRTTWAFQRDEVLRPSAPGPLVAMSDLCSRRSPDRLPKGPVFHQAFASAGLGGHHHINPGSGPHRMVRPAVMWAGILYRAHARSYDHRRRDLTVCSCSGSGGLQNDLTAGLPEEIGNHQSAMVRHPVAEAPIEAPVNPSSQMGVSIHAVGAELLEKAFVWPKVPRAGRCPRQSR